MAVILGEKSSCVAQEEKVRPSTHCIMTVFWLFRQTFDSYFVISLFHYFVISLFRYFVISLFRYFVISFFRSFVLSFFRSFVLSLFRYFVISLFRYFVILLFQYLLCLIINPIIVLPVRFSARLIFYLFILSFVRLSDFPFFPVFLLTALFALAFLLNGLPSLMNLWTTLIDVFLLAGRN
jgi:hypothetical protein